MVISLGLLVVGLSAFGQSLPIRANIPFPFIVADRELAAGEYTARMVNNGAVLEIQSTDGRYSTFMIAKPVSAKTTAAHQNQFVFNRYGEDYFLSKVWWADYGLGSELDKSSREIGLAKLATGKTVNIATSNNQKLK